MAIRISIFFAAIFILSACATNDVVEGPSLEERIKTATQSLKIVTSKSADWCGPAKACKYIGEIYCDIEGESSSDEPEKECKEYINKLAVHYGGDTIVYQQQGNLRGPLDHYRSFGQLYNCTDANQQLNKEYTAEHRLKPLSKLTMVSKTYSEMCKTTVGCKKDERKWSCGSMQADPHKQCRRKFDKNQKRGSNINHIVYKDDLVNKAGFYRLYIDSYTCK